MQYTTGEEAITSCDHILCLDPNPKHLEVADGVVDWQGRQVGARQVDGARGIAVLDQPLQGQVVVASLAHHNTKCFIIAETVHNLRQGRSRDCP